MLSCPLRRHGLSECVSESIAIDAIPEACPEGLAIDGKDQQTGKRIHRDLSAIGKVITAESWNAVRSDMMVSAQGR
jgi:hypothetical protein